MSMLENIVAATDLSAASRHAADRAAQLAHAHDVSLTLVHALAGTRGAGFFRGIAVGSTAGRIVAP